MFIISIGLDFGDGFFVINSVLFSMYLLPCGYYFLVYVLFYFAVCLN